MFKGLSRKSRGAAMTGVVVAGIVAAPLALGVHAASASDGLFVNSQFQPDQEIANVNAGNDAEWFNSIENDTEGDLSNLTVVFDASGGSINLAAGSVSMGSESVTPNKVCKKSTGGTGEARPHVASVSEVTCSLGALPAFDDVELDLVLSTNAADAGSTIEGDVTTFADPESSDFESAFLEVNPVDPTFSGGFVPAGGTINQGPKVPTADVPASSSFKLPKKEIIGGGPTVVRPFTSGPKAVAGPGVPMEIELIPADDATGECGGQDCMGPIVNFDDFSGYNDPKHPALITVNFFGGVYSADSHLYIIENGVGTLAQKCTKLKGIIQNFPCIVKEKFNKKTGEWTDVVAVLSGDGGYSRRR